MFVRTLGIAVVVLMLSIVLVKSFSTPSATPDPALPTFAQVEARLPDRAELAQAHREGRLIEDPVRGELRRVVMVAYEQFRQYPCDEVLKRDFIAALIPFIEAVYNSKGAPPVEIYHGERGELNATAYLDGEVIQELSMAAGFGLIDHDELPS